MSIVQARSTEGEFLKAASECFEHFEDKKTFCSCTCVNFRKENQNSFNSVRIGSSRGRDFEKQGH